MSLEDFSTESELSLEELFRDDTAPPKSKEEEGQEDHDDTAPKVDPPEPTESDAEVENRIGEIMKRAGTAQEKLDGLMELLQEGCNEAGAFDMTKTTWTIRNGKVLITMKALLRESKGGPWAVWAQENIPFLSERTRQNWMLLARYDCEGFACLGEDRLLKIIRRQKASKSPTPIKDFLSEKGLLTDPPFNPLDVSLKGRVDEALRRERSTRTPRGSSTPPQPVFNDLLDTVQQQAQEILNLGDDALQQVDLEKLAALETTFGDLRARLAS